jgi:Raf kinase inhibitor-like YbhB/YbcL family protein
VTRSPDRVANTSLTGACNRGEPLAVAITTDFLDDRTVRITAGLLMLAALAIVALTANACGRGGPASPTASALTTAPSIPSTGPSIAPFAEPSPSATQSQEASAMPFTLTSTAFDEGGAIPRKFSCDGEDVSPALSWDGAPDGAAAFALIVDDPDARGFVHWVVFDMTGSQSGGLAEAVSASPDAPRQGRNGFGRIGWGGPCPPSGTHHYRFTLLALDGPLGLTGTPSAADVRGAAKGHTLGEATLTGTYHRGG